MPVMGAAHSPFLFWDGRKDSLWSQALGPLEDAAEHGGEVAAPLFDWHYGVGVTSRRTKLLPPGAPVGRV